MDDDDDEEWLRRSLATRSDKRQGKVSASTSSATKANDILQGLRAFHGIRSRSSNESNRALSHDRPNESISSPESQEEYFDVNEENDYNDMPTPRLEYSPRPESVHSLSSEPMIRTRPKSSPSPVAATTPPRTSSPVRFTMKKTAGRASTLASAYDKPQGFPVKREASETYALSKNSKPIPNWSKEHGNNQLSGKKLTSAAKIPSVGTIEDSDTENIDQQHLHGPMTVRLSDATIDDLSDDHIAILNKPFKHGNRGTRITNSDDEDNKDEEEDIVLLEPSMSRAAQKKAKSIESMISALECSADQSKMLPEEFRNLGPKINGLNVDLLEHQIVGVKFLLSRESPKQKFRGGLLCDDMGLGKTIQSLGAIILNPCNVKVDSQMRKVTRTTLVVCPLALIRQWEQEITTKTHLSCLIYHGPQRAASPIGFSKQDVIITTYQTLRGDHATNGPLFQVNWWRAICDEAHIIKQKSSKTAQAAFDLPAQIRWCLTGTPVQGSIDELYSFFKFIRVSPFDDFYTWRAQITRPINAGQATLAFEKLHKLLAVLMLRRTKALFETGVVKLPERRIHKLCLEFSDHEMQMYEDLRASIKHKLKVVENDRNPYLKMLTFLLRLRQACDDFSIVASLEKDPRDEARPEELEDPLLLNDEDNLLKEDGPVVQKQDSNCGTSPVQAMTRSFSSLSIETTYSSKIEQILDILSGSESTRKTIIYTQFSGMLTSIQSALHNEGISFQRFDGSMTHKQRQQSLETFKNDATQSVLLCSLKVASLGLNLTCASRVILVDPWWNEAVANQAIDRVHRIGQTKAVDVYELIMKDSVEEDIIRLQQMKSSVANSAIGGANNGDTSSGASPASAKLSKEELFQLLK